VYHYMVASYQPPYLSALMGFRYSYSHEVLLFLLVVLVVVVVVVRDEVCRKRGERRVERIPWCPPPRL